MSQIARLGLVGEYKLFRECLASMLSGSERFTVEAQASDLGELQRGTSVPPDLVLYDVGKPRPEVLESIGAFVERYPGSKLVALGLDEVEDDILKLVEAGASAYVLKEVSVDELQRVIEQVMRGEAPCSPKITSTMFSRLADLSRARRQDERLEALDLTPRELEILQLIADGLSNKEIAVELCLSFHTIKNHVHKILEKLQVQHRSQAVEYAERKRWFEVRKDFAPRRL